MNRNNEPLEVTLYELRQAGLVSTWTKSGKDHWKIKAEGLPVIIVSSSPSDGNAPHQARRLVRRILAQRT